MRCADSNNNMHHVDSMYTFQTVKCENGMIVLTKNVYVQSNLKHIVISTNWCHVCVFPSKEAD